MCNEKYPLYEVEPVSNIKELVNHCAEKYSDKPAFLFERKNETVSISYRQFKSDVDSFGTALFYMELFNGKAAIIGENSYEWILTYFSVVNSGNVIVPLDRELSAADIKNLIIDSGAEVFIFSNAFSDIAVYLQQHETNIKHYINMGKISKLIKQGELAIKNGNDSVVNCKIDNNALTAILYTSGTTGISKGVMLTHKGLALNAASSCQNINFPESSLLILPLHHSFAFTAGVLMMMMTGTSIAINQSLKNVQSDILKYKPRNILMVPLFIETFYKQIYATAKGNGNIETIKKIAKAAFGGNLTMLATGGAPLDKKYIIGFRDMGITVLEGYGITECSPVVSVNRNQYYRDGSIGQVIPSCKVKIAEPNESGHGEICVKGDIVMLGYYKNEQATKEAFDGEWFMTGDLGYLDTDGFLYITGRKKNLIVLNNGKNVYPEELEKLIANIPFMKEVIVRSNAIENGKESMLVAEIFPDYESARAQGVENLQKHFEEAIASLNKELPFYKHIQRIVLRDVEFIKTTTKKIKRNVRN